MAVVADPKKLLIPDPEIKKSFLSDKIIPFNLALSALVGVIGSRHLNKRPIFSGIQFHIMAVVGGWMGGKIIRNAIANRNAEKDAIYMHYIDLHPDDFPMPKRTKIGDKFEPWAPVR